MWQATGKACKGPNDPAGPTNVGRGARNTHRRVVPLVPCVVPLVPWVIPLVPCVVPLIPRVVPEYPGWYP